MLDIRDPIYWDFLHKTVERGAVYNYMEGDMALAITIRTAAGGAKGTSRTIQAVDSAFEPIPIASQPAATPTVESSSFDTALTEDQRRRRDAVPIPYVHEGEGVDLGLDEEDDEEI
jgi:elongator complex protein 5